MNISDYYIILLAFYNDLQNLDTHWRKAVTPKELLAFCFRYENKDYWLEGNIYFHKLQLII
jgi:hypothetical protein